MLLVGVLAVSGGVGSLRDGDTIAAATGFAIGAFLLAAFVHQRREQRVAAEFRSWLAANAAAILQRGGAQCGDTWVTADTRTRQLTLCISMIVVGFKLPSRPLIEGHDTIGARAVLYSLLTMMLGWWSLHGLLWTPVAMVHNLRGGKEATLREHLIAFGLAPGAPAPRID